MDNFKITLKAARVNAGLTQKEVAAKMGVTNNTIVNWELGKSEPKVMQARQLAELYGVSIKHIFLPCESN